MQLELDWTARLEEFRRSLTPEAIQQARKPRVIEAHELHRAPREKREKPETPNLPKPAPTPKPDYSAERCREAADAMTKHIEAKHESADNMLAKPPTRKRMTDAAGIRSDARFLEKIQNTLYQLAEMHEAGTCPPELKGIVTRAAVERERYKNKALEALMQSATRPESREAKVARMEAEAKLAGIPGFFPTPAFLADKGVRMAGPIKPGTTVFEPGAGSGAFIDAVLREQPEAQISYCEINYSLRNLLATKYEGNPAVRFLSGDIADVKPADHRFDLVVMNPPFESGQDIQHTLHAWELVKPGGQLISILGEGAFYRKDAKAEMFRAWLNRNNAEVQDIEAGAFRSSGTGVKSRMIYAEKY